MNIVPWIFRVEIAFNNSSLSKEPVRPQARRPVIFEPGASRSCPLRPQREASAESIAAKRVQIRRRQSPPHP